jgi:hypothetical protein
MKKSVAEDESPKPTKGTLGKCPHCSDLVDGFKIDAQSRDDVVITLKPCGCVSETNDDRFSQFVELVDASGSLKPVPKEIVEPA